MASCEEVGDVMAAGRLRAHQSLRVARQSARAQVLEVAPDVQDPHRGECKVAAVSGSHMERYWDARAREDAYYFVDSRLDHRSPDEQAFWDGGEQALERLLDALEVELPSDGVV